MSLDATPPAGGAGNGTPTGNGAAGNGAGTPSTVTTKRHHRILDSARETFQSLPTWARWLIRVVLVIAVFCLPYMKQVPLIGPQIATEGTDWATALFSMTYYALLALGLNVVVGYAGMLDLGYVGFFAIGAYTVALLTASNGIEHWPWLAAVPIALALATISGLLLGWPTLRLRGDYLAIVTLAFAEIIHIFADSSALLKGNNGFTFIPHPPGKHSDGSPLFGIIDGKPYYWLGLVLIFVVVLAIRNLDRSRVGRSWLAIREDEEAAEVMGVRTVKFKLWAFAIGAFIAGLSGLLFAGENIFVNSDTFILQFSILVLAAVVMGGSGNMAGAILGGALISYIPDRLTGIKVAGLDASQYRYLLFGAVILLIMIFRPQGLIPSRRRAMELRDREAEVAPQ